MATAGTDNLMIEAPLIRQGRVEDGRQIRDFLLESSDLYPGIERWWDRKVRPGASRGERVVIVAERNGRIEGIFIGKRGQAAKLCTLRLREAIRGCGAGRALAAMGIRQLLERGARSVRVTISEGAGEASRGFFEALGFRQRAVAPDRYVDGVGEYVYSAPANRLRSATEGILSGGVEQTLFGTVPVKRPAPGPLLFSIRPEYAELILQGRKQVEFRRKFSHEHEGALAVFYVSQPVGQFAFSASIAKVAAGSPRSLWGTYRSHGGVPRRTFDRYFKGARTGFALVLQNVAPLPVRKSLEEVRPVQPDLRPPQSFMRMHEKPRLLEALGLTEVGCADERGNTQQEPAPEVVPTRRRETPALAW